MSSERPALSRDQRGAMFVMGIPICLFMIGLLYFVIGLGEDFVIRERMQDAADATALSAAVVHARGMNLIALLNNIMAALVSLLIMVRLLEALLIAAMALATALAWPSAGASMSVVPPSEAAREEADNAWNALQEVINPIIEVIHGLEVGIKYGMPAVAEARAIATAAAYKTHGDYAGNYDGVRFGFAVPGSYPLPLKDGTWPELCGKAGGMVGQLIALPIGAILPFPAVRDAIVGASQKISQSFSNEICSTEGGTSGIKMPDKLPDVPLDQTKITKTLPPLASTTECTGATQGDQGADMTIGPDGLPVATNTSPDARIDAHNSQISAATETCKRSAQDLGLASMASDGNPTSASNGTACTYNWQEGDRLVTYPCAQQYCDDGKQACGQFTSTVEAAPAACKPNSNPNLIDYNYQQRDLTWRVEITPTIPSCDSAKSETCPYTVKFDSDEPAHTDRAVTTGQPPCGSNPPGLIGPQYNESATYHENHEYADSDYFCVQPHQDVEPSMLQAKRSWTLAELRQKFGIDQPNSGWTESTEYVTTPAIAPDSTAPNKPGSTSSPYGQTTSEVIVFTGKWSAVTFLHSCDEQVKALDQTSDYKDQSQKARQPAKNSSSQGGDDGCSQGDQVHMDMADQTKDNVLGGGDYQMRSVVLRRTTNSGAKAVVREVPLRLRGGESESGSTPIEDLAGLARHVYAAQAEYYFNTDYNKDAAPEHTDDARSTWTWIMKWKARMRRFRFPGGDDASDSSCAEGWSSHGTQGKTSSSSQANGPEKLGDSGSGDSGSASGASACDQENISAVGDVQTDFESQFEQAESGSADGSGSNQPAADGGGDACGTVSALKQLESLIIH